MSIERTRWVEIIRRVALIAGVLAAAGMLAWPTQAVWRVGRVDFARLQKARVRSIAEAAKTVAREAGLQERPQVEAGLEEPLDRFIARETRNRLHEVHGPAWAKFFEDVGATLSGRSRVLAGHLEDASHPNALYFALTQEPVASLRNAVSDEQPLAYVRLADADPHQFLAVTFQRSAAAMRDAPNFIAFPWRKGAVWVFLAALAVYCFLPRPRSVPGEFRYHQARAAILPDGLGISLTTLFFVLPILIIASNAVSYRPWGLLDFSKGWGVLTLTMWLMALGGIAIIALAAWYATFSLFLLNDRLRRITLLDRAEFLYSDIQSVEPVSWTPPRWLKGLMIIAGLINRRLMGPMILGTTSRMTGIQIRCKQGRTVNVWLDHLPGASLILQTLQEKGVRIAPQLLDREWDCAATPRTRPASSPSRLGPVIGFLAVGGAALAIALWPRAERVVVPPRPAISPEIHARQQLILLEMRKLQPQLKAASEAVGTADPATRAEAARRYENLMGRFQELHRQFEELDKAKYLPEADP